MAHQVEMTFGHACVLFQSASSNCNHSEHFIHVPVNSPEGHYMMSSVSGCLPWILVLAWHSSGCRYHLESELADGSSLTPCFFLTIHITLSVSSCSHHSVF